MFVEIDLLNSICDVGPNEGEILNSVGKTSIGSDVGDRGIVVEDLGLRVHECRTWLVIQYVSALQDIQGVFSLLKKYINRTTLKSNPKKVVKRI